VILLFKDGQEIVEYFYFIIWDIRLGMYYRPDHSRGILGRIRVEQNKARQDKIRQGNSNHC